MGLLTLNELAGLGNNGLIALAPPPPASQPGQGPMGPARQYIMPGQRLPVRSMLTASAAQPYAPVSRARTVRTTNPDVEAMARSKAAHDAAVRAAALAQRRARAARTRERATRARPVLTAVEKERLRFEAWKKKTRERNRREAAAKAAKEAARRERIAAMDWTAPVSSYPFDLRPVKGESWTEGLKRDWFAMRRGFSAGDTYEKKARDRARARQSRQRTRDALIQTAATERQYKSYARAPEAVKQAVFESKASPYIVSDVKAGHSAGGVMLREAYRRYVR